MGKITFILGGVRSGKSTYALEMAKGQSKKVAFIATAVAIDEDMQKRIDKHREQRPKNWVTFEETKDILLLLKTKKIGSEFEVVVIDCLTILISNLLLDGLDDNSIENKIDEIFKILKDEQCAFFIVSNEVGLGVHPPTELGRRFRDLAGRVNQIAAAGADEVFFMVSGLPLAVKKEAI